MKRLNQIYPLFFLITGLKFMLTFLHQSKLHYPEIIVTFRELTIGFEPRVVDAMECHQIAPV